MIGQVLFARWIAQWDYRARKSKVSKNNNSSHHKDPLPAKVDDDIKECMTCYDNFSSDRLYFCRCSKQHHFCYACMGRSVRLQLTGSDDTPVIWPTCPLCSASENGSSFPLAKMEIEKILYRVADLSEEEMPFPSCEISNLIKRLKFLALIKDNYIRCPKCPNDETASWHPPIHPSHRIRIDCLACQISFCSKCFATPYHYHGKCEALPALFVAWHEWKEGKEAALIQEFLSSSNASARAVIKKYLAIRQQYHSITSEEITEKIREIQRTETFMEATCRICPSCGIPAVKVSGCDHVVCGNYSQPELYHSGCGKAFQWSFASRYKAVDYHVDLQAMIQASGIKHGYLCNICKLQIVGPRIRCIHCPSYNLCFDCITKQTSVEIPADERLVVPHPNLSGRLLSVVRSLRLPLHRSRKKKESTPEMTGVAATPPRSTITHDPTDHILQVILYKD